MAGHPGHAPGHAQLAPRALPCPGRSCALFEQIERSAASRRRAGGGEGCRGMRRAVLGGTAGVRVIAGGSPHAGAGRPAPSPFPRRIRRRARACNARGRVPGGRQEPRRRRATEPFRCGRTLGAHRLGWTPSRGHRAAARIEASARDPSPLQLGGRLTRRHASQGDPGHLAGAHPGRPRSRSQRQAASHGRPAGWPGA